MAGAGVTLVELLVAIFVSGFVLLAANGVLAGLTEAQRAISRTSRAATRVNGGERLLRSLVLANGASGGLHYSAPGDTLRFGSWCPSPFGWLERCVVRVTVGSGLVVAFGAFREQLDGERRAIALLFLQSPENGGNWLPAWTDTLQLPLAVGVVRADSVRLDTLILRIGTRG